MRNEEHIFADEGHKSICVGQFCFTTLNKTRLKGTLGHMSQQKHVINAQTSSHSAKDYDSDPEVNSDKTDSDGVNLLVHEKQKLGLSSDPEQKLSFTEPDAKSNAEYNTFDVDHTKKIHEFLHAEQDKIDKSELEYLNHDVTSNDQGANKFGVPLKEVYKQAQGQSNNALSDAPVNNGNDYIHKLLNINSEGEELNVTSQSNSNEGSNLELIRQPSIENVHDHGYITVINSDDDRNTRISKMAEYNKTTLGSESKGIVDSYNRMSNMSSQQVNNFMQAQDIKTQSYFRPIINQTLGAMNQDIIRPKDTGTQYSPYFISSPTSSNVVELKKRPGSQVFNPVILSDRKSISPFAKDRSLLSHDGYWGRKANSAFKALLSGKF